MNIHEYQAKTLLAEFGVSVPRGQVAFTVEEAMEAGTQLGGARWVVKAQIHAGGRGKGGGVKIVQSQAELQTAATNILGMQLITHQTGPAGRQVKRIYIEEGCTIARELYLGMLVDRGASRITVIASTAGGMDIETVAAETPEQIVTVTIDPVMGLQTFHARRLAFALQLKGQQGGQLIKIIQNLYRAFIQLDANLIEINPLVVTAAGNLLALDAKMNFDSNGLYRQPAVRALRDLDEEEATEVAAHEHGLNYIKLDGAIGCMVNGAGLAMATMDIIQLHGAAPANFLDVGGGATAEKVTAAFKIILADPNVEGILVNIFGGIMRCDVIAEGIVQAVRVVNLQVPLVVRLEGTNVEQGKAILTESSLAIIFADDLGDAAAKIVGAVAGERRP